MSWEINGKFEFDIKNHRMALRGLKVIELAGLAPAPVCGMILSDFGAQVIRVDKVGNGLNYDVTARGKRSIALNLKRPEGVDILRKQMF